MPHNTPDIFDLPSFPAPDLSGVLDAVRGVFNDLQGEVTGSITNISQAVLDIWEMDCGGKWIVYINTGAVALTKALWLLLTPDLDEILENYLQPKPGRRHGRRGQRGDRARRAIGRYGYRLFFRPPIPDIDEVIASLIPGSNALKGRRMGPGEWIFWTAVDVADAILWHWLLLVATETFTVEWTSELMQSGECKYDNDAIAKFSTAPRTSFTSPHLWLGVGGLIGLFEEDMNVIQNGDVAMPAGNRQGKALILVRMTWTLNMDSTPGEYAAKVGVRVTSRDIFNNIIAETEETTIIAAGQDGSAVAEVWLAQITERWNKANFSITLEGIANNGGGSLTMTSDVSIAVRGVTSV